MLKKDLLTAFKTTVAFLVLCGLVFPLVLVGIGQIVDRPAAEGSVLTQNGTVVGSSLVGQFCRSYAFSIEALGRVQLGTEQSCPHHECQSTGSLSEAAQSVHQSRTDRLGDAIWLRR